MSKYCIGFEADQKRMQQDFFLKKDWTSIGLKLGGQIGYKINVK